MVVFGSNLGWQCFFAALMYGVEVDGFEIVPYRHRASVLTSKAHDIGHGVRFHLEDAGNAKIEWSRVGLVYMTDLNWDESTSEWMPNQLTMHGHGVILVD